METLDAVDRLYVSRVEAEAGMFELAAHFADLHSAGSLHPGRPGRSGRRAGGTVLPGMERAVRVGGVGTPRVAEFMVAELGGRMRMGSWSARRYVADALDVRHRLPLIWARVRARQARVGNARLVATRTRHLSVEAAACVDAAMVDFVDGSLPWGRFESRLAGKVVAADPALAAVREAERVAEQFAKRTRSSEQGTAGFYVRSTVGVIARIEATVSYLAEALSAFGDADPQDVRRVKAVLLLANPARALELMAAFAALRSRTLTDTPDADPGAGRGRELPLDEIVDGPADEPADGPADGPAGEGVPDGTGVPVDALGRMDAFARRVGFQPTRLPSWLTGRLCDETVGRRPVFRFGWAELLPSLTLYLHLSHEDLVNGAGGVVRWEGEGPVTHDFVHQHLRPLHDYVLRPVLDPAGLAPVDAYEVPDRHRRAVHLRTPAETFPYSSNTSRGVDLDHTLGYQPAPAGRAERHWSTRMGNLGPLARFGHRVKTHGHWTLRQPFEGIYLWRDPHGQIYLVDHTGTHKITHPGSTAGKATTFDPDIELHPAGDTVIEVDFDHTG